MEYSGNVVVNLKKMIEFLRACLNFPEIMLDRLYRPIFIRHIVSVMFLTTTENILESNSQNCVGQNSEQALNNPLFIH